MHIMLMFEVPKCSTLNTIVFYHLVSVEFMVYFNEKFTHKHVYLGKKEIGR